MDPLILCVLKKPSLLEPNSKEVKMIGKELQNQIMHASFNHVVLEIRLEG